MPLYDYRCTECDREVEVMHGIHDSGPETCDACGGAMRKALSPPAIHFKGSGWAKKDAATAGKAKPKTEPKDGASTPGDSSSETPKTDKGAPGTDASTATPGKAATTAGGTSD